MNIELLSTDYKLKDYEVILQKREINYLNYEKLKKQKSKYFLEINNLQQDRLSRLTFFHYYNYNNQKIPTWQKLLESESKLQKKNSKYVTHGIHNYKGKFYPQLVKSLLNISQTKTNSVLFDPFCGSGTVALEGYLNGMKAFGCDLNPLAVLISRTKLNILNVDYDELEKNVNKILSLKYSINDAPGLEYFLPECRGEIKKWFPLSVIKKISFLRKNIDSIDNEDIRDFLLIILSGIIRNISQQDPKDLRIRYRKFYIKNAPVMQLYRRNLKDNLKKIKYFQKIKINSSASFHNSKIWSANNTKIDDLKKIQEKVDIVITSPPYATALPYIDTDRLSLLTILDQSSIQRKEFEFLLTGSREIRSNSRKEFEDIINRGNFEEIKSHNGANLIKKLYKSSQNSNDGFRRKNMPSLLYRYFKNISLTFANLDKIVKKNGSIFIVVGDSFTVKDGNKISIPTTKILQEIGCEIGWKLKEKFPISVTTENLNHSKQSITTNHILFFKK